MRLIADGLNGRWSGREKAYLVSPAKVCKFERLYAAGFSACVMTGTLYRPGGDIREALTVSEALRALSA